MARVSVFIALALFTAAVTADYIYNDDQIDEINSRMVKCLYGVPAFDDFDRPSDFCRFEGIDALSNGAKKEALTKVVSLCLKKRKVDPTIVAQVQVCFKRELAKDV